ncbi:MAG: CusA/CzcA family heavy metal efflux RND transporter [Polyangiaceae bacterium]
MELLTRILRTSIAFRWAVLVVALLVAAYGAVSLTRLPIDAVPDITNVQVQVNTAAPSLAPVEVEQQITYPIEAALQGIPHVAEVRSLSRYGLSQVTVVFEDGTDLYFARQLVGERLASAKESLPSGVEPSLGPIATGLGEIYMWSLEADPEARKADGTPYDLTDLRTLEDWVVRPQLRTVPGVTEVNAIGGFEKLYQIAPNPTLLRAHGVGFRDVLGALNRNSRPASGAGYIEHKGDQYLVRAPGLIQRETELTSVLVTESDGSMLRLGDVADVGQGKDLRTGAATVDGREAVIGTAIMLYGENSRAVARRVDARLRDVQRSLPEGVHARTLYDRTYLVDATLKTVARSLIEGAALVVLVLFLLVGNLRAALIAALAIPFSMLLAGAGMLHLGISGNLMSLGAIDFGLIVDGSVIIVENCVRRFAEEQHRLGRQLEPKERRDLAYEASAEVIRASFSGVLIITAVYVPILSLTGIEGKMFRPMAETVILALAGATLLSITLIPAVVAIALRVPAREEESRLFGLLRKAYVRLLDTALRQPSTVWLVAGATLLTTASALFTLGAEFSPKLSEGAIAIQPARMPSIGLSKSVEMQGALEAELLREFPDEIDRVFARTGTAEVATDPMGPNVSDTYLMLKPSAGWKRAKTQEELTREIAEELEALPGQSYEVSQPIELRFNELISGVRSDVAVKVFGDDLEALLAQANRIAAVLKTIPGAADLKVEQTSGLPVLTVDVDREAVARYGLAVEDVQEVVEVSVGGASAGQVFEGDKRFDLVVRLPDSIRADVDSIRDLPVAIPPQPTTEGAGAAFVPLSALARISIEEGPNQVSRENGKRRVVVQCNVRGRDMGGFVAEAEKRLEREVKLPEGTWIAWGGQFENLVAARRRLTIVIPITLFAIVALLFVSLRSAKNTLLILTGIPLAITGGVLALVAREIPISISAAIGFIALSGVAVLNGLVMVTFIENLRRTGTPVAEAVRAGSAARLRPVLMTALVAALGFVPMAISTGMGSEVQRPLATVVIGGILSSTVLTLVILPVLYERLHRTPDQAD